MKVCVYFEPSENRDNFEGARLRKNIKGALEIMGIPYCNNIVNKYDLIHFISIKDEEKINDAIESHIPTVISAFMCENDITARITNVRNENVGLSLKAIRVLNKVDRVLVPNQTGKEFLLKHGITSKIDVVTPGVKLSRFLFKQDLTNLSNLSSCSSSIVISDHRKSKYAISRKSSWIIFINGIIIDIVRPYLNSRKRDIRSMEKKRSKSTSRLSIKRSSWNYRRSRRNR